jgi:hypothetical protein
MLTRLSHYKVQVMFVEFASDVKRQQSDFAFSISTFMHPILAELLRKSKDG